LNALAILQVASYGAALEAANIATNRPSLELTEIMPFGTYALLVVQGEFEALVSYRKVLRTADLQKSVIIENPDQRLVKSLYHLENQKPQNFLLILESDFVGYLLQWAQALLPKGLEIVDLRQPRLPGGWASLILTGAHLEQFQADIRDMEQQKIRVSFVENLNSKFRNYFEIEAGS